MARFTRRKRRDDIRTEHDDFYEALPYQQRIAYEEPVIAPASGATVASRVVYAVLAIIETLLALRFLFLLLGAQTSNAIVNFVYNASYPLVQPFIGMFDTAIDGVQQFSVATLVAMAFYALLAWLLMSVINAFRDREVY